MTQEQNPLETQQQPETATDEFSTTPGQETGAEPFNTSGTSELEPPTLTVESVVLTAENAALRQEIEGLQEQLAEDSRQFDDLKTRHLSLAAEFDNFRKRTTREKEELQEQIKGQTLEELLPAIDNFERARNQIKPANEGEMGIHKSYQGVYKILVDSLKRLGVYPMRPEGEPFDPKYHEAMLQEPTNEHPEGTVIEQLVRGYMLGERVLRHALVKVAAAKEEITPPSEEEVNPPEIDKEEAN